ncbi:MAG: hypothetical protein NTV57_02660 [Cyanobacteria bacterium]|nr:hypothetical protein [Cyanobacteriota bacterium]
MGNRPSCRSCRHCTPPNGVELGWCQLRQLPIHQELVADLCCHHWTGRQPRLPAFSGCEPEQGLASGGNQQLSLGAILPQS